MPGTRCPVIRVMAAGRRAIVSGMPAGGLRERLLAIVDATRDRERELLALCDDVDAAEPGRWTAKDHVAHLTWWRNHAADVVRAARLGIPVERFDDIDAANERTYRIYRDRSADDVREDSVISYLALAREIEAAAADDFRLPRPDRPEMETWQVVPPNLEGHLAEHLSQWYLEQGDENAADSAQLWAFHLDETFDSPKGRAAGAFNLACYYAKRGRADDAISRLRDALALHPELVAWARADSDLESIRDRTEVRTLLAVV